MARVFSRKIGYKFRCLSDGNDHEKLMEEGYAVAFRKGYSAVEIARVAGMKSARYVHAALVKTGEIASAKPGRRPNGIVLPNCLEAQLKLRGLSFAQWCSGWSFSQDEALAGIQSSCGAVMAAIRRDFPGAYRDLTGAAVDDFASGPAFEHSGFTVAFDWDGTLGCYKAEITEFGICTYGDTYESAFHAALIQRKGLMTLSRLEALPDLNKDTGTG